MIFAKLDVTFGQHHRVLLIPVGIRAECIGVWTLCLLWTRCNERDGFCPLEAIDRVAREKVIEQLVRVGLLSREVDEFGAQGVRVLRYEAHNETKAHIDSRKADDRRRKVRLGQSVNKPVGASIPFGIQTDSDRIPFDQPVGIPGSDSDSGSVLSSETEIPDGSTAMGGEPPLRESGTLPASERALWGKRWVELYELAVTAAAGHEWGFERRQMPELEQAIDKFCRDKTRIEEWIDRAVREFVRATRADDPKLWSSYQPRGLRRWFNEGRPGMPAKAPDSPANVAERARREADRLQAEREAVGPPDAFRAIVANIGRLPKPANRGGA
jgi:hypothetical protein